MFLSLYCLRHHPHTALECLAVRQNILGVGRYAELILIYAVRTDPKNPFLKFPFSSRRWIPILAKVSEDPERGLLFDGPGG